MKNSLLCLLILVTLFACTQAEKQFPQEATLTSKKIPMHTVFSPLGMQVKGDFLILKTQLMSPLFQVYSTKDYQFKNTFGILGKGPGEFINPYLISSESDFLYIGDYLRNNEIQKFVLDSTGTPMLESCINPNTKNGLNDPILVNDSILIFNNSIESLTVNMHYIYGNKPDNEWQYGSIRESGEPRDENKGAVYGNNSFFAFLYQYRNQIDFLDGNLNVQKRLNYQKGKPTINQGNDLESIIHYTTSYAGERYLYAMYVGAAYEETKDKLNYYTLEVYNMQGSPVCRYRFADIAPRVFAVDEKTNTLFGYRSACEDSLLVYHLTGLP